MRRNALAALRRVHDAQQRLDERREAKVRAARAAGAAWDEIAQALRASKQAVHRRWRHVDSEASTTRRSR